jgi:hypothetical protein
MTLPEAAPLIYRTTVNLNLRIAPRISAAASRLVPRNTLIRTDLTVDDPRAMPRTGYDDPTTPEPARVSSAWVRVVAYQSQRGAWVALKTPLYAAYEWLELERNASGVPL